MMDKSANKMCLLWNFTGDSLRLKDSVGGASKRQPYPSAVVGILVITQGPGVLVIINW